MRQPPKQEWFYRCKPLTFFFSFYVFQLLFSLVLHLAWVSVTIGSPADTGWHMAHTCHYQKVCCVSQHSLKSMEEIPGYSQLLWESWTGPQKVLNPSAGPVSSFVQRGRRNDLQQATDVSVSDQTVAFAVEHQNWQVLRYCPVLFTDESRFAVSTCDRCEETWGILGEHYAACNIIQHHQLGGWVCDGLIRHIRGWIQRPLQAQQQRPDLPLGIRMRLHLRSSGSSQGGDAPGHQPSSHQEHTRTSSGMLGPYKILNTILSCCNNISAN